MHIKFNNQEEANCPDCQRNVARAKFDRLTVSDINKLVCSQGHPWILVSRKDFDANEMPEVE